MIINRIIIDTLEWLKTIFWHKNEFDYKILEVKEYPTHKLIELKRETKRSLLFYLYVPKTNFDNQTYDENTYEYYICLDHLGRLDASGDNKYVNKIGNTHSFSIIKTKKWLKNTSIEALVLVYTELNFRNKVNNKSLDDLAITVVKEALNYLQTKFITEIKWPYLLNYIKVKTIANSNNNTNNI